MRRTTVGIALCIALSGCAGSAPRTSADGTSTPTATSNATAAATAQSASPLSAPLSVRMVKTSGRRGDLSYVQTLPVFTGSLAAEVNRRVARSLEDGLAEQADEFDIPADVEVRSDVTVNDGRTVQVRLGFSFLPDGAPHPLDTVSTVVLRRADAAPVMLSELLTEPSAALAEALRHASTVARSEGRDDPAEALTTNLSDWADWQAGPAGMNFFFDAYKAGGYASGLREVAVPWSVLRTWAQPDIYALLS